MSKKQKPHFIGFTEMYKPFWAIQWQGTIYLQFAAATRNDAIKNYMHDNVGTWAGWKKSGRTAVQVQLASLAHGTACCKYPDCDCPPGRDTCKFRKL